MNLRQYKDIPKGYYKDLAMAESSGGKHQRAFKINEKGEKELVGTAAGDFQFVKKTWNGVVKRMGKPWTEDDRFNSKKSREAVEFFTTENEKYLTKKLGREPNKTELYASHHFGNAGANKFLTGLKNNPNADSSTVFSADVLKDNPHLVGKTVMGAYNELARRIKGKKLDTQGYGDQSKEVSTQSAIPQGIFQDNMTEAQLRTILDNEKRGKVSTAYAPMSSREESKETATQGITEEQLRAALAEERKQQTKTSYGNVFQEAPQQQPERQRQLPNMDHLYNYIDVQNYADGGKYTVKSGDTLSRIAKRNNTTVEELQKRNKIQDVNKIQVGQRIALQDKVQEYPYVLKPQEKVLAEAPDFFSVDKYVKQRVPKEELVQAKPKTFAEAFKVNRARLGPNKVFEFEGRMIGTNIEGETFNPSEEDLAKYRSNTKEVKDRLARENEEVKSPFTEKNTVKLEPEYKDWDEVKKRKKEINKMDQASIIQAYHKGLGGESNYIIVDKKKGLAHVYNNSSDEPVYSAAIDSGQTKGDAQTVTKINREKADKNKDGKLTKAEAAKGKADFSKGNKSTGAGRYTLSNIDKVGYRGEPLLNMVNDQGIEVATSFHKGFKDDNNSRVSNGCVRCSPKTLDFFADIMQRGDEVYILPEDEGNKFIYENGVLNFRTSSKKDYNSYVDSNNDAQSGQGINRTTNTLKYNPIHIKVDKKTFAKDKFTTLDFNDEEEYENTVIPFVKTLESKKQLVMKLAQINGDAYNDIAKVAVGILGVESEFGDTHSTAGNFARATMKYFNKDASSPDYSSKEFYRRLAGRKSENTSTGLTQIRWAQTDSADRELLKQVGITSAKDFGKSDIAALATVLLLANRYKYQLSDLQKMNIQDNLPKTWNKRPNYSKRVKDAGKYFKIKELN